MKHFTLSLAIALALVSCGNTETQDEIAALEAGMANAKQNDIKDFSAFVKNERANYRTLFNQFNEMANMQEAPGFKNQRLDEVNLVVWGFNEGDTLAQNTIFTSKWFFTDPERSMSLRFYTDDDLQTGACVAGNPSYTQIDSSYFFESGWRQGKKFVKSLKKMQYIAITDVQEYVKPEMDNETSTFIPGHMTGIVRLYRIADKTLLLTVPFKIENSDSINFNANVKNSSNNDFYSKAIDDLVENVRKGTRKSLLQFVAIDTLR